MKGLLVILLSAVLIEIGRAQDCLSSPCDVNACCVSTDGSSDCVCRPGFQMDVDGFTCIDIDECEDDPCSENAFCVNADGSYVCLCNDGFTGDGFVCDDVDECADNTTCGANAFCENGDGNFTCECDEFYEGDAYCGCTLANPCMGSDPSAKDLCGEKDEICVAIPELPGYECQACESKEVADDAHLKCAKNGRGLRRGQKSSKSKKPKKGRGGRGR